MSDVVNIPYHTYPSLYSRMGANSTKLSCYEELTEHEKFCCDNILARMLQLNRTGKSVDDDTRKEFWESVFSDWHTGMLAYAPFEPDRFAAESSVVVGTFTQDTRRPTRAANYRVPGSRPIVYTEIPDSRRQGAPVSVQVVPKLNTQTFKYRWVDSENRTVPRNVIDLNDLSVAEARARSIAKWDHMEMAVQGNFNVRMAVWYARLQVTKHFKQRPSYQRAVSEGEECPACEYQSDEQMQHFKNIRLCGDFISSNPTLGPAYREFQTHIIRGPTKPHPDLD